MRQVRAVSLWSYLDVANFLQIDGLKLLAEAGISPSDLYDSETRLPADAAVDLLERSAAVAECDSLGILMAQCRSYASLGPVSLLLQHLDTVRNVIDALISFRRTLNDVLLVALDNADDTALVTFDLIPPHRRPQAANLTMGLGLLALRGASGGRWSPEAVHFTHGRPRDVARFERFFRAPLQFDSVFNGFSCPLTSLAIELPLADSAMAHNASRLLRNVVLPPESAPASDHVRQTIALRLSGGRVSLQSVAAQLSCSARALQRSLEAEGQTFGGLLEEVRREAARHYLAGSTMSVTDIAEQLGYTTPTSFARWFRAQFGTTAREWRANQQKHAAGRS